MLFSFENIYRQYLLCRQNKRNSLNALHFEYRQEENLLALQEALSSHTYCPSRSVCFYATRPKLREIFAADFTDRIVHHILVNALERTFEPIFIHDSYACRKGKGIHRAVLRLQQFMRKVTGNGCYPAYYIQLDIKNYFMSIDKEILFSLIARHIHNEEALWLSRVLIFHDCTKEPIITGDRRYLKIIPAHKTLFLSPKNKGLPIGNLNSQFFANVYLNGLDQFVKHHLRCSYYLRYCDDFLLLSRDRGELIRWKEKIEAYLGDNLGLELNHKRQRLQPVSNGVDFLGYIVRRDYLLVRRRVVNHLRVKLQGYETLLVKEGQGYRRYLFDEAILDQLAAILSSYLGHFKLANTYHLCSLLFHRHPFLAQYLAFDPRTYSLVRTYKNPKGFRWTGRQYNYYRCRFPGDVIFFQVGRFIEFYHVHDRKMAQFLGLARMTQNRRGAHYGFPLRLLNLYVQQVRKRQYSLVLIREREHYWTGIKERAPLYRLEWNSGGTILNSAIIVVSARQSKGARSQESEASNDGP